MNRSSSIAQVKCTRSLLYIIARSRLPRDLEKLNLYTTTLYSDAMINKKKAFYSSKLNQSQPHTSFIYLT